MAQKSSTLYTPAKVSHIQLTNNSAADDTKVIGAKEKSKKKTKHVIQKLHYPLFLEAAKTISDIYWVNILTDMAYNKCCDCFSLRYDKLIYRQRTKIEILMLAHDPGKLAVDIITFIKKYGLILSPDDKEERRKALMAKIQDSDKKRNHPLNSDKSRLFHISNYIKDLCLKYNLSLYQSEQLKSLINLSYFTGILTKSDFKFNGNNLISIDGIIYNNKTNNFCIHPDYLARINVKSKSLPVMEDLKDCDENNYFGHGINLDDCLIDLSDRVNRYVELVQPNVTHIKPRITIQLMANSPKY